MKPQGLYNEDTDLRVTDEVFVEAVDSMGDDMSIIRAAQVSVVGHNDPDMTEKKKAGLINYLMVHRHGSPFEHATITLSVMAPIFVFREFHRHRIGWSYNEMSGRYKELEDLFYIPRPERPLVQVPGTAARPRFEMGTPLQHEQAVDTIERAYLTSWKAYKDLLAMDVAKEVARVVLPVGIFSQMYATANPRSIMAFLSLRTKEEGSTFPSYPQDEIELVARQIEAIFAEKFPLTYAAWNKNGRVAP